MSTATKQAYLNGKKPPLDDDPDLKALEKKSATIPAQVKVRAWIDKVKAGIFAKLLKQHSALDGVEIGFGLLTVLGAPPGAGKTAFASQVAFDALELDETLNRVVIANAETDFDALTVRQMAKATKLNSNAIRLGALTDAEINRVVEEAERFHSQVENVHLLEPCDFEGLMMLACEDDPRPGLLIVDYLQKFTPKNTETKDGVTQVMSLLRKLARDKGWAVLALSATARKKDKESLTMSSFRESSEIEFNADSAYLLTEESETDRRYVFNVKLTHAKNRHGPKVDRQLVFNMPRMEFTTPISAQAKEFNSDFEAYRQTDFCDAFGGDD